MASKIYKFFDKLEDRVRMHLSKSPLLYAFVGGVGVVLFWRGVWNLADHIELNAFLSVFIGGTILLITGVFISALIGTKVIISDMQGEKKLAEKTEDEVKEEEKQIEGLQKSLERVEEKIEVLESEILENDKKK